MSVNTDEISVTLSSTPAGTVTLTVFRSVVRPVPLHGLHFATISPRPVKEVHKRAMSQYIFKKKF